jgi:hypothetical protein
MVSKHCLFPLAFSFYWHLALQWQDLPKEVALIACTDPALALTSFSHGLPRPLVVIKAWKSDHGHGTAFEAFKQWKINGWSQWYQMSPAIRDFLKEQVKDETLILKGMTSARITDGKVFWRPLEPSKAELLEEGDWPSYVKDARSMALHLLAEAHRPLTMPALVEMAAGVYERQTIYNAVNKLLKEGEISKGAWADEDYGAFRLTGRGNSTAYAFATYGRAKGARSLSPRI